MRVRENPRGMGTGGMTRRSSDSIPDTATTPEKKSCGEGVTEAVKETARIYWRHLARKLPDLTLTRLGGGGEEEEGMKEEEKAENE